MIAVGEFVEPAVGCIGVLAAPRSCWRKSVPSVTVVEFLLAQPLSQMAADIQAHQIRGSLKTSTPLLLARPGWRDS